GRRVARVSTRKNCFVGRTRQRPWVWPTEGGPRATTEAWPGARRSSVENGSSWSGRRISGAGARMRSTRSGCGTTPLDQVLSLLPALPRLLLLQMHLRAALLLARGRRTVSALPP
ncbi:unnamed protein product, partial [Pylaiella littoralis]